MIDTEMRPRTTQSAATVEPPPDSSRFKEELGEKVTAIWRNALEAADAQAGISGMKLMRLATLACFGILGSIAMVAILAYGFSLLDWCFAYALSQPGMPPWLAPLVRGALYFGVPMIGLIVVWHSNVGYGSAKAESKSAVSER